MAQIHTFSVFTLFYARNGLKIGRYSFQEVLLIVTRVS